MSDKKFCDYCGEEIDCRDGYSDRDYYKVKLIFYYGDDYENELTDNDICKKCLEKGVIVKEDK